MKLTSRFSLMLLVVAIGLALYFKVFKLLSEFNFDVARTLRKMAKHPAAWIDWSWLVGASVGIFIMWLKKKDDDNSPTGPQWGLMFITAILISGPCAFLLYLYLHQRHQEKIMVPPA